MKNQLSLILQKLELSDKDYEIEILSVEDDDCNSTSLPIINFYQQ